MAEYQPIPSSVLFNSPRPQETSIALASRLLSCLCCCGRQTARAGVSSDKYGAAREMDAVAPEAVTGNFFPWDVAEETSTTVPHTSRSLNTNHSVTFPLDMRYQMMIGGISESPASQKEHHNTGYGTSGAHSSSSNSQNTSFPLDMRFSMMVGVNDNTRVPQGNSPMRWKSQKPRAKKGSWLTSLGGGNGHGDYTGECISCHAV